jgi:hypothetical protein
MVPVDGVPGLALKGAASSTTVAVLLFVLFRRDVSALLRNRKAAFAEDGGS